MGVRFEPVLPNGGALELGASVPRRGNRASRWLARLAFRLWGWRFAGSFPDVPKAIVVVAPHTTNWDFLVGMLTLFALGLRISWLGKHTLFRWPLRPLMLWLDGVPVRRDSGSGTVAKLVETMRQRETMLLAVAPEGTRRAVSGWRRRAGGAGRLRLDAPGGRIWAGVHAHQQPRRRRADAARLVCGQGARAGCAST
jgi:1-acyl-sn-glycerol-3-phosphate acyltransferase